MRIFKSNDYALNGDTHIVLRQDALIQLNVFCCKSFNAILIVMFMIDDISAEFAHKSYFCNFSAVVHDGEKIGVIGRNGCGKSSLLTAIYNQLGSAVSYLVPQIVRDNDHLSGGERFNKKLSEALSHRPDVLLLDESTNHPDIHNRKMLKTYNKIVIVATHDVDILQNCIDTIYYIHNKHASVFAEAFYDFLSCEFAQLVVLYVELSMI